MKEIKNIEDTQILKLKFQKNATDSSGELLPVVVQEEKSKDVLLVAYLNLEAFQLCLKTKILTLWSRSRNCLWIKGKTSGNSFVINRVFINCEQNSFLFMVTAQKGGICHTKNKKGVARKSCFYRELDLHSQQLYFLEDEES